MLYLISFLLFLVSSVNKEELCLVKTSEKCVKEKCSCTNYIRFSPKTWYQALISVITKEKCKCKRNCRKKAIRCKNGVCDRKNFKCLCSHCWTGEQCTRYVNLYQPYFEVKDLEVNIPRSYPHNKPIVNITSRDQDNKYCKGKDCPCGEVSYEMLSDSDVFAINQNTGALTLVKTPKLSYYTVGIIVQNREHNFGSVKKLKDRSVLKVSVAIQDSDTEDRNTTYGVLDNEGTTDDLIEDEIMENDILNQQDEMEDGAYDSYPAVHRRSRRSVVSINHPLLISAVPYLDRTYYFNKGDNITFKVRLSYNTSYSGDVTAIRVQIRSQWLSLKTATKNQFDYAVVNNNNDTATFTTNRITSGVISGNLTVIVKDDVGPLSSLYLELEANASHAGEAIYVPPAKSTPIVYAVFPTVNVTRNHSSALLSYQSLGMNMNMKLPLLNYTLLVELTTNIEDYIFMEIRNVSINRGSQIRFNGSDKAVTYSSQGNGEIDRVAIDFGYVTVPYGSSENDREIDISFAIQVNDHPKVARGSQHWVGVGLQAGPDVLWVEQQSLEITKNEPALEFNFTHSIQSNFTRLYIGDKITFEYVIGHAATSERSAKNIVLYLFTTHLLMAASTPVSNYTHINDTVFRIHVHSPVTLLRKENTIKGSFDMKVGSSIAPLITIPVQMTMNYDNVNTNQTKRPVISQLTPSLPLTGTPLITYLIQGTDVVTPGDRRSFSLTILLTKMRSPLQIELVMPEANGEPIMTILSFEVVSIGSNIVGLNTSATAVFSSTTYSKDIHDQAILDLGTGLNNNTDTSNTDQNQVNLKFEAVLNENANITNGTSFWVGAGVVGKPKMVWVGQLAVKPYISATRKPYLDVKFEQIGDSDEYEYSIFISHSATSDQYAYNMTFQYYLPPFVEYVRSTEPSEITKVKDTVYKLNKRFFYFTDQLNHSITVRLNRAKSPRTGLVEFAVPVRLSYSNQYSEHWQYFRSLKRSMQVLSREPTIPKHPQAKSTYYGRGFYWDKRENPSKIYVCKNQHVMSSTPACYMSTDDGISWIAMDSRIGCILGHKASNFYALHRNQMTYMKFIDRFKDWYPVVDADFPILDFRPTNVDGADRYGEPKEKHIDTHNNKQLAGTGDGLYFRNSNTAPWNLRAKWNL